MTVGSATTRERFRPWISALGSRLDRVEPREATTGASVLLEQLTAIASNDLRRAVEMLAPDVVVRAWGWVPGGHWSWAGDAARSAMAELLAHPPVDYMTMRVDIDRFFPGGDIVGFDGDISWLADGSSLGATTADRDPGATYLVARRLAVFATCHDGVLSELDVYLDIHELVAISDRPT
jgi:hypothetical protein